MESETFAFSADINQLLSLIINTIYSNKEVFLRELISNASDALNKIRYNSLTDPSVLDSEPNLEIKISFDKPNKVLIIHDTGIGMTKEDLINNLGTIASSGTKKFLEAMTTTTDMSMIGQFGVGFYSAYLVADKVIVISKANNSEQYIWESLGNGSFTIQQDSISNTTVSRGTIIMLYLKDDMLQYLEEMTINNLIKKHNQFIDFPIYVEIEKTREVEEEEKPETTDEPSDETKVTDVNEDEEKVNETPKKTETYTEYEQINKEKPIWTRNPKDVTEEEYGQFYKNLTNDYDTHLAVSHFSVEGQVEYKALLYTPKRAPGDLFDGTPKKSHLKLYVRKVFITDNCDDLIPDYLKFVKGIVESDDIPLNISRETLQQNKVLKVIGKNIVKRTIEMFTSISEDADKFRTFYEQYSKNIKLGIHEDETNRTKLCTLLRYETSKSNGDLISLDDYIKNMKEGQNNIYYITGESVKSFANSPFMERLKSKDYEVIYMADPLDEYITQQVKTYQEKKLINITKENIDLNDSENEKAEFENAKDEFKTLCEYFKNILGDDIDKVIISNKLADSPCVLSTGEFGWSANMQRIVKAQALGRPEMSFMMCKKTLEINPKNKIILKMKDKLAKDSQDKSLNDLVMLLYEITLQSSGFTIDEPSKFTQRIIKLISLGLGVDDEDEELPEEVTASINEINAMESTD
jgi:molecular chaperone HtpG